MNSPKQLHSFHIPVMGIAYTIDSPVKVAQWGISSVVSLVDDILIEKMRKLYSMKFNLPFQEITDKMEDFRAKRIQMYLDMMDTIVKKNMAEMKESFGQKSDQIEKYMAMLPDFSEVKQKFQLYMQQKSTDIEDMKQWLQEHLMPGSIDVNIMTKLDKANYTNGEKLPTEYNDAHAALRGFAQSSVNGSIVLSAGMNPMLYSYFENFDVFYPDADGNLSKRIILKVSDYRSALIQGKMLAKKGIWISEYRIESGLNCGGHAFATDGYLLGPILQEFKDNRATLYNAVFEVLKQSLLQKGKVIPNALDMRVTAQGGIGTAEEHDFLIEQYQLDSLGWGTPFMLVPEAVTIDDNTLQLLKNAKEDDLYLSNISPLGVPFNSVRGNTKDEEKQKQIEAGRPGFVCTKKYAVLNTEFTDKAVCMASRQYQKSKLEQISSSEMDTEQKERESKLVQERSCICVGLGTPALIANNIEITTENEGVSVCPGPNMAYFNKIVSLRTMTDHIYKRIPGLARTDRPHVFLKELSIYIDYLQKKIEETAKPITDKQVKYFETFNQNLNKGIEYYYELSSQYRKKFDYLASDFRADLGRLRSRLEQVVADVHTPAN